MPAVHAAVALAAAVAAAAAPLPAAAVGPVPDPTRYGMPPRAAGVELTLSYMAEAGFANAVKLTCEPPGGGHPDPVTACATLASVGVDPGRIEPAATMCIMLYAPVTATVTGRWRKMDVNWTHRFGNSCEMRRATGQLFAF